MKEAIQSKLFNMDWTEDVYNFNQKIIGTEQPKTPKVLSRERLLFALTAMYEELYEFTVASNEGNIGESVDAIIDLIYFALGRCYEMGIDIANMKRAWYAVHEKNMQKTPGQKNRGTNIDAVKPDSWEAADLNKILDVDNTDKEFYKNLYELLEQLIKGVPNIVCDTGLLNDVLMEVNRRLKSTKDGE